MVAAAGPQPSCLASSQGTESFFPIAVATCSVGFGRFDEVRKLKVSGEAGDRTAPNWSGNPD